MEKKYPVLKCDNEKLWLEIKEVLKSFGISDFYTYYDFTDRTYIVSNFGDDSTNILRIGITVYDYKEAVNFNYRYLVNTKEEFLSAIAELLDKEYCGEEKTIKINLKKAKEWYKSDNKALKELALQAFTKDELNPINMNHIIKVVDHSTLINSEVPKAQEKRWIILCKLACIAKYLNGDWIKTTNNKGYFIGISKTFKPNMLIQKIDDFRSIGILEHSSVIYSGIIYFEKLEYITKALEILDEDIKTLFEY